MVKVHHRRRPKSATPKRLEEPQIEGIGLEYGETPGSSVWFRTLDRQMQSEGANGFKSKEEGSILMLKKTLMGLLFTGVLMTGSAMADVIIRVAPPRPIVERRIVRPGPRHVWIAGYHRWDGRGYAWVPGRWELPPGPRAHWVAHRYVRRGGGWVFVEGHWR